MFIGRFRVKRRAITRRYTKSVDAQLSEGSVNVWVGRQGGGGVSAQARRAPRLVRPADKLFPQEPGAE